MNTIIKANIKDASLISKLSIETFLPAHGHSAPKKDIESYINLNFTTKNYLQELSDAKNIYHLFYLKKNLVGYSKIVFNDSCTNIKDKNVTYLSRIYFLESYYGLGLAKELLDFNINLCSQNNQKGIWLKVWIENKRAIQFYKKNGFKIVGKSGFKISETHSNPNHHMYLEF